MELRPGYKQTGMGVIPEEWKALHLPDVCWFQEGPGVRTHQFTVTGVKLLNGTNIFNGQLRLETTTRHISNDDARGAYKHFLVEDGDILLATSGVTIDKLHEKVAFARAEMLPLCMNTSTVRFKALPGKLLDDYLYFFLQSDLFKTQIARQATGSAQLNFGPSHLKKVILPVAMEPGEQLAIAGALRDVDGLIRSLDQLIAKKRDLKQAAMQQLLTGRTRLPGFSGGWDLKRLVEIGTFSKGKSIRKDEVVPEGLPCIRYGEIYTHHADYVRAFFSFIPAAVAKQSQRLRKGDLLFAGSGETADEIGKCVAFLDDVEAYAGGDIVILSPVGQDSMYLGYLMNHPSVAEQKARMGQGDAVVHISARNLAQLNLRVPLETEQAAIAAVLSDMDAELRALDERLAKTRALKQGMMQELLTGRTRLV